MLTAQQLATRFAKVLATTSGEFSIDELLTYTDVDEDKLLCWLDERDALLEDRDGAWLDTLADVWEAFAAESHLCAIMYAASLKAPKREDEEPDPPTLRVV